MGKGSRRARPAPEASAKQPERASGLRPDLALPWLLATLAFGFLACRSVLTTYFAQDDFRWLRMAAGGIPIPWGSPRFLSMHLAFRELWGMLGFNAVAWHAVHLGLHLACGTILFVLLMRRLDARLAAAAAAVFLSSPALFDATHWVSAIADLLAGLFLLITVHLLTPSGRPGSERAPWVACVAFALAMASKEIAVGALPLLLWIEYRRRFRAGAAGSLARMALLALPAAAMALRSLGTWSTGRGEAYSMKPAAALLNLPAYVLSGAFGGIAATQPSDLYWSRFPWVTAVGWILLAGWVTALALSGSRRAWFGFAWFVLLASPVLMLERQFYGYYLYCAMPGMVYSIACLLAAARRIGPAAPAVVMGALALLQMAGLEVRQRSTLPLAPLPTDFVLRRALVARNALSDLARAGEPASTSMVFIGQQPVENSRGGESSNEFAGYRPDPFWDDNVRSALSEGEAVQLALPGVREVKFRQQLTEAEYLSIVAAYTIDGHLRLSSYREYLGLEGAARAVTLEEHLSRASTLITRRAFQEAIRELRAARDLAPENPDVLLNLGGALARVGDTTQAVEALRAAVKLSPRDPEAWFNLGLLEWRTGRQGEAREAWNRLEEVAPGSDLSRSARSELQGRRGAP